MGIFDSISNFGRSIGRDVSDFASPIIHGGEDLFTGRFNKLPQDIVNIGHGFEAPFNKTNLMTTLEAAGLLGGTALGADALGLTGAGASVPAEIAGGAGGVDDLAGTGALGFADTPTPPANIPGISLDTASLPAPVGTTDIGTPSGFSATDAELSGGITGSGIPSAAGGGFDISSYLPSLKSSLPYLGLGGLAAATLLGGKKGIPQQGNLQNIAGQAGQQGQANQAYANQLEAPLTTGVLPAGAEQSVVNATNDAITSIKSRYAQMGLSGSTQEQDAINAAQEHATAMRFSIAEQMAQTGLSAGQQAVSDLGLQDQVYGQLMQAQIQQDTNLQNAIARFTGAIGGGIAGQATKSFLS